MPSTRRAFVAAAVAGLAGCTALPTDDTRSPPGERSSPSPSDGQGPTADSSPNDCTAGFTVSLDPFAPSEDLPMRVAEPNRTLVAAAVDDGETNHESYGEAPLRAGVVAHDGSYYWLTVAETGSEAVPAYLFDISWENGRTAPEDATLLQYDDLPASDQEAVRFLVPDGKGEEDMGHPTEGFSGRDRPVPYPAGGDGSELLGYDTVWVGYEGREYRVSPGERTTTERHRYRYTAEQLATDDAGLREWAADRYLVDLSLSEPQRHLLSDAAGDYYEECEPASDALAGIQAQLPEGRELPHPGRGWYVSVDGTRHRIEILRWVE